MTNEELAIKIQAGENELSLQLWQQVKRLIFKMCSKYFPIGGDTRIDIDDLTQAGYIGMLNAVKDFKPDSGLKFTSYLNFHIKGAAFEVLGMRSQKRDPILKSRSLNIAIGEEGDNVLQDFIEDKSMRYVYPDLIERIASEQDFKVIEGAIRTLKPQSQDILTKYYYQGLTYKAIAQQYECGIEFVRQDINRSLRSIRNSKAVRILSRERAVDKQTNFYARKGLAAYNSSFTSAVEEIAIRRERTRKTLENLDDMLKPYQRI